MTKALHKAGTPGILVFARNPRSGRAKTRLAPAIGQDGANRLHGAFLADTHRFEIPRGWSPSYMDLCLELHHPQQGPVPPEPSL